VPKGFIPPHGGYRKLLSYQRAEVVYDATVRFCARFLDRRDRTVDQMVQAARSGKQNIIEASVASGTSKETEIKLTNVARASLEELLAFTAIFCVSGAWMSGPKTTRMLAGSGNWSARRERTSRRSEKASSTPIQPFPPMSSSG